MNVVINTLRLRVLAVNEIPPGNLNCKRREGAAVHIEDLVSFCVFEVWDQVLTGRDLPHVVVRRHNCVLGLPRGGATQNKKMRNKEKYLRGDGEEVLNNMARGPD